VVYRATAMGQKKGVVAYRLKAGAATPTGTTPAGATIALRTLRQGMRGDDVRTLQTRLGIGVDGIFGSGTKTAVIAYQRANGLDPDGVVGKNTWASLMGGARA
jgi:peptidoglycan hydrolase-like protein with peptidoglycan-binding domain